MTAREFCYWLQGFFEVVQAGKVSSEGTVLPGSHSAVTHEQAECIKRHLALVFKHEIDPSYPNQPALNAIHNPPVQIGGVDANGNVMRC